MKNNYKNLTREEALELLKEQGISGDLLKHIYEVNKVAVSLAKKINKTNGISSEKNERKGVDVHLVNIASLLHDIGKPMSDKTVLNHVEAGYKILAEKGYPKIAEIVRKHGVFSVLNKNEKPETIEEKIVFYADKTTRKTPISLDERFDNLINKRPEEKSKLEEARKKTKELEKELLK